MSGPPLQLSALLLFLLPVGGLPGGTVPPGADLPAAMIVPGDREGTPPVEAADTLRLEALHRLARRIDPRSRQLELHRRAGRARIQGLDDRWLPSVSVDAEASYQTEVPTAVTGDGAEGLPSGLAVPEPPRDRYDAGLRVEQLLYDGGAVSARKAVERATVVERSWETRASLYGLREEVDGAFFAALRQGARRQQVMLLLEDLRERRRLVTSRVEAGSLIPAQLAAVEAKIIEARQELDAAASGRRQALSRLSLLIGRDVAPETVLAVPDLRAAADAVLRQLESPVTDSLWLHRPEVARLESLGDRLRAQADVAGAASAPAATAFVRGAVGRPGLDFFQDSFSPYAVAGVRLRWPFFDGGASEEEARALRLRAEVADAEREALGRALRRRAEAVRLEVDRLSRALRLDDDLVEAREERRRAALRQLEEGVLLPADYVERRTDVYRARLQRRLHRVELAAARARLLRVLGRDLPESHHPSAPGARQP